MILKFGDPESIEARNKGRVDAVGRLSCPRCGEGTLSMDEMLSNTIDWFCQDCDNFFTTDLSGENIRDFSPFSRGVLK